MYRLFYGKSLKMLNDEQKSAVEHINNPLLILAGAGTGKTKTLVAKISYLVQKYSVDPASIMAVTFTNKAANEMIHRICAELNNNIILPWVGTFHTVALKILRLHCELLGLEKNFIILDTVDQLKILKDIANELDFNLENAELKKVLNTIQGWKDKALLPEDIYNSETSNYTQLQKISSDIYIPYQKKLKILNYVDFGDLLLYNLQLFKNYENILEKYQFRYIMVDEYQDTNCIQYLWIKLLSNKYKNLCCVGDDDQSIYGWRGANIDNILRFNKDFVNSKIIKLECNYRSTYHIIKAASGLISYNESRLGKDLWTKQKSGNKVRVIKFFHAKEEANYILNCIKSMKFDLDDTAILVRASFQTRLFEEFCIKYSIPYKIVGGLKFYERKEIKDLLAYFRISVNLKDDLAFDRMINTPKRGLGSVSMKKIYSEALNLNISFFYAAKNLCENGKIKSLNLEKLLQLVENGNSIVNSESPQNFLDYILDKSGYKNFLIEKNDVNALENINEFFNVLTDFSSVEDFVQHVSLLDNLDSNIQLKKIKIITLHSSKGLEFKNVFLPGWEEGLFPHNRAISERNGLEEERRLAYVGMTRAKEFLCISCANNRMFHNFLQYSKESRFLIELPSCHLEVFNYNFKNEV